MFIFIYILHIYIYISRNWTSACVRVCERDFFLFANVLVVMKIKLEIKDRKSKGLITSVEYLKRKILIFELTCIEELFSSSEDMVSTNNPWHELREQLMHIDENILPSAPFLKEDKSNDSHWIEFDLDVFLGDKINKNIGCWITIKKYHQSIVIANICNNYDGLLRPFDIILTFNDIHFNGINEETAQCIIQAHQIKPIKMRLRRLQPSTLETIEFNLEKQGLFDSGKLGCTIDGGIDQTKSIDPGIFIRGIQSGSRAANNGRLRIGDRLMQISNTYTTVNLQCIQLNYALKLIQRMRKESTMITLVVAHQM